MAGLVIAAVAAIGLPEMAKHVPWVAERWLGRVLGGGPSSHDECRGSRHPASVARLQQLLGRIYPLNGEDAALPIAVDVVRGNAVNAFASLGGHIYVFEGLLKQVQTPEELAGVLAHEIEHVKNRHIIQGAAVSLLTIGGLRAVWPGSGQAETEMAYRFLTLKFSRQQETEADEKGLERLRKAGVDAKGFRDFFLRAKTAGSPFQILSSHPDNDRRAELASRFRDYPASPIMNTAEWEELKAICQ